MKAAGCDFVELLVPEPGELDLAETRAALADAGLGVELAARVNARPRPRQRRRRRARGGIAYLEQLRRRRGQRSGRRSSAGRSTARRWFSPAARPPRSASDERTRRIDAVVDGLAGRGDGAPPMPA